MIRVTFDCYARALDKWFVNVEHHRSEADARLRAAALGWLIRKIEPFVPGQSIVDES